MHGMKIRVVLLLSLLFAAMTGGALCQTPGTSAPPTKADAALAPSMPLRSGEIIVKVNDFETAREQTVQALIGLGAQLIDAKTEVTGKGRKHGWLRVSLPVERLPEALPILRGLGKLYAEKINTDDSTSEYESLARRVEKLQQHQERLAGILSSERRLRGSDILYVQDRLFRASVDESMLTQQREDIARESRMCTLNVALFEPEPTRALDRIPLNVSAHFESAKTHALEMVDRARARAVTASAYALVFAPVWVPLFLMGVALVVVVVRLYRRFALPLLRGLWGNRLAIMTETRARFRAMGIAFVGALPERLRGVASSIGAVASAALHPAESEGGSAAVTKGTVSEE